MGWEDDAERKYKKAGGAGLRWDVSQTIKNLLEFT